MSGAIGGAGKMAEQIMATLRDIQSEARGKQQSPSSTDSGNTGGMSFADHLKQTVGEVNQLHKTADRMGVDLATGKSGNIHDTMLAATQAELSFNLMVQLRNKALEAYTDVMKMPV